MIMHRPRILAMFGSGVLFGQELGNIEALAALQSKGCEVLCLIRDDDWSVSIGPELTRRGLKWNKVKYIEQWQSGRKVHALLRNPYRFLMANFQFIRESFNFRPTHFYAFNPAYFLNFLPSIFLSRAPLVYRGGDEPVLHNWIWRLIWKAIQWRTSQFVAISCFIKERYIGTGIAAEKILVIYNAPPTGSTKSEPALKNIQKDPDFVFFEYHGQLIPEKGVGLLVDAFRVLLNRGAKAKLLIAGRISDWAGDEWARRLIAVVNDDVLLRERVIFTGYISNVSELLTIADVNICPSLLKEGLGNVVMEAKKAGRPSIVFPCGGLPEMISHGIDGYICADCNVECLVDALSHYENNRDEIFSQGEAARASLAELGIHEFSDRWLAAVISF